MRFSCNFRATLNALNPKQCLGFNAFKVARKLHENRIVWTQNNEAIKKKFFYLNMPLSFNYTVR